MQEVFGGGGGEGVLMSRVVFFIEFQCVIFI